jgi:hypothetical protein
LDSDAEDRQYWRANSGKWAESRRRAMVADAEEGERREREGGES